MSDDITQQHLLEEVDWLETLPKSFKSSLLYLLFSDSDCDRCESSERTPS